MNQGLPTTFRLLTQTVNKSALPLLVDALDGTQEAVRAGALVALLQRNDPHAVREILRRFDVLADQWWPILEKHRGALSRAAREALVSRDEALTPIACRAAMRLRDCDLIAPLLLVVEDPRSPHRRLAARSLSTLLDLLYRQLGGARDDADPREAHRARQQAIKALEGSIERFSRHRSPEVVEGFLLMVERDNAVLRQILLDGRHTAYAPIVELLSTSQRGGVMRLVLSFLEEPRIPAVVLNIIARRQDTKFVGHLLHKIEREPLASIRQNLRRIESFAWLSADAEQLEQLDDASQRSAVRLAMACGMSRPLVFQVLQRIVRRGHPAGRLAAVEALSEFQGAEANELALDALADADPLVQAAVVRQVRGRGIPDALPRLLALVESPHAVVREAVREALGEITFARFLAAYDMLDEEVRHTTGLMVRKVDSQAMTALGEELRSQVRARRLRALGMARAMECVATVEDAIVTALDDADHLIRVEAATTLARGQSPASCEALERVAREDRSSAVQAAARESLQARGAAIDTQCAPALVAS